MHDISGLIKTHLADIHLLLKTTSYPLRISLIYYTHGEGEEITHSNT